MRRIQPARLTGNITIPASKSDSQRALLAAGLAQGISTLIFPGNSEDDLQMIQNIQAIGAKIHSQSPHEIQIEGTQGFPKTGTFNLGESGLGFRLMFAQFAAHGGEFVLEGKGTLQNRPHPFFEQFLPNEQLSISSQNAYLPFTLKGQLSAGYREVDGTQSSQYLSGLLMALPLLKEDSVLEVPVLNSQPYVAMTLSTLSKFGIRIEQEGFRTFRISGSQNYQATRYTVEGDWSSAAFWLVASALGQAIVVSNCPMQSLQADKAILTSFLSAGCKILHEEKGLRIEGSKRRPFEFDATHCPDLFPALTLLAAMTEGNSRIKGLNRLKGKESDRGKVLQMEFEKLGIAIHLDEENDVMTIQGKGRLLGGKVHSHHDHRIAMTMGIAGLVAEEYIEIENDEAVGKSYPEFWEHLASLETK